MTVLVPTNWNIQGIESMADWASELTIISSSIVAKYCHTLLDCDVHLIALTQPHSNPLLTTTPPCKSYINAAKVYLLFSFIFLAAES